MSEDVNRKWVSRNIENDEEDTTRMITGTARFTIN